jgi:hypothetical protein
MPRKGGSKNKTKNVNTAKNKNVVDCPFSNRNIVVDVAFKFDVCVDCPFTNPNIVVDVDCKYDICVVCPFTNPNIRPIR